MPKSFRTTAFILILVGVITICSGPSCSSKSYSGPVESITLGMALQEPSIPVFVAADRQFFTHNGLDVTIKYYDNGGATAAGVLNEEVQLGVTVSDYVLVNQVLKKSALKTFGCLDLLDYISVIARKDSGIAAISDL
jgi:ABC-type nitrate/sulfonate/bicarbonate transport system substrate-binding protein